MISVCPHRLTPAAFALALAFPLSTCAQQTTAAAEPAAAVPMVVVTATRTERDPLDVPASVDVVGGDQVRDAQLRVNLSESLVRIPGLVLLNRQNYAQDLQLSIRGFGARASFGERGVRLYVDGVPATLPDGQGQVSHFPLDAADRIEVLRGPFSALYGNSSGGVISITSDLKPQPQRFDPSFAAGSHGTWRAGFNGVGGEAPYAFGVDATRFRTDGARTHSAARRDLLNIRGGFLDSPLGELRVSLNAIDMPEAQDPLGLTRAQFQVDPTLSSPQAIQFDTRKSTRQETAGASLRSRAGMATLDTSLWIGTRSVTQYQAIPVATQLAATSPGGVIDFDRRFGGGDLRATVETGAWTSSAGLDVERMNEARRGYNNYVGTAAAPKLGVEGTRRRDDANVVESFGPYVQTEAKLGDAWRFLAGARYTRVNFESSNHLPASAPAYGSIGYSGVGPTAGVVFRATPRVSAYLSYGRGFETPTLNELAYRPDGSAGLNTALQAASSNNLELGAKAALADGARAGIALFTTRTHNDLVVRTNSGGRSTYANVDRTRRDGIEASVDWPLSARWSFAASATAIDARFETAFLTCAAAPCTTPSLPVAAGNKLPAVPARDGYVELKYRADWADLTLDARTQSALFVDDRNTDHAGGYAAVDFSLARTLQLGSSQPRVFARVDNLLDRGYAGSVIVNEANSRFFEPALGRTWLIGVDWPL
ncbi:MAG TPA: TonB-dependent receptor [Burkholderiaceae bacterium]